MQLKANALAHNGKWRQWTMKSGCCPIAVTVVLKAFCGLRNAQTAEKPSENASPLMSRSLSAFSKACSCFVDVFSTFFLLRNKKAFRSMTCVSHMENCGRNGKLMFFKSSLSKVGTQWWGMSFKGGFRLWRKGFVTNRNQGQVNRIYSECRGFTIGKHGIFPVFRELKYLRTEDKQSDLVSILDFIRNLNRYE